VPTVTSPAPPVDRTWARLFSSEDPAYGGAGTPETSESIWPLPGESATLCGAAADTPFQFARR
jgi:hypothetical protein